MYYLDEEGKRVYTLKVSDCQELIDAHCRLVRAMLLLIIMTILNLFWCCAPILWMWCDAWPLVHCPLAGPRFRKKLPTGPKLPNRPILHDSPRMTNLVDNEWLAKRDSGFTFRPHRNNQCERERERESECGETCVTFWFKISYYYWKKRVI